MTGSERVQDPILGLGLVCICAFVRKVRVGADVMDHGKTLRLLADKNKKNRVPQ
jgi:hypothetical protein